MLLAAGADPRAFHKVEGFGSGIAHARDRPAHRGRLGDRLGRDGPQDPGRAAGCAGTRFEGGGCNWSFVDDGYDDEELTRIAARLTYSKLGLGSHKCTSLHGVAGAPRPRSTASSR